jgi:hypothetical protein
MKVVLSWVITLVLTSVACGVAEGPVELTAAGSQPGVRSLDEIEAGGAGGAAGASAD